MEERLRFIARVLDGEKMAGLCREFGITRKTGYARLVPVFANIYDDQTHTVPASDNEEWSKVSAELEEAEAALTDAQSELLYFISGNH